jgi:protein-tyrosine phosphatase
MSGHILIVCTANVCRSPVAAALLQRALDATTAPGDPAWAVRSAGTSSIRVPLDANTVAAAAEAGLTVGDHVPRPVDRSIVARDGADLVLTMSRAHLREVVALDPASWPRSFTLKELVRRASEVAPAAAGEPLGAWLGRLAVGRRAAAMIKPDPDDDVEDPYGLPHRAHRAMVEELSGLVDVLVRRGPW